MATYVGTVFNDYNVGPENVQYGLDGNDHLSGSINNKAYHLYGGDGNDFLDAYDFNDFIYGGNGNDTLIGRQGNDLLVGDTGNDALYGSYGNDILIGGPGRDLFIFDTKLNANQNTDKVEDFHTGQDLIYLSRTIFAGIGALNAIMGAGKFGTGNAATTPNQRIIYNPNNGFVFYTPDGSHSSTKIRFAELDSHLSMHNTDFFVIA